MPLSLQWSFFYLVFTFTAFFWGGMCKGVLSLLGILKEIWTLCSNETQFTEKIASPQLPKSMLSAMVLKCTVG